MRRKDVRHRRHRRRAPGRRRHPRGRRPGRRAARRQRARVRHADALPGVRHRAAADARGRQGPALPQRPLLPGAAAGARCSRWPAAAALDIEGLGYEAARSLTEQGLVQDEGDVLLLDEEALRRSAFYTTKGGALSAAARAAADQPRGGQDRPLWRLAGRACRSGTSAPPTARPWPGTSARWSASRPPRSRSSPRSRASAPSSRRPWPTGSPSTGTARSSTSGGGRVRALADEGAEEGPRPLEGVTRRRHRHAGVVQPRRRDRGRAGARRQGHRQRQQEDRLRRRRRRPRREQVRQGGQARRARCSTTPACARCSSRGPDAARAVAVVARRGHPGLALKSRDSGRCRDTPGTPCPSGGSARRDGGACGRSAAPSARRAAQRLRRRHARRSGAYVRRGRRRRRASCRLALRWLDLASLLGLAPGLLGWSARCCCSPSCGRCSPPARATPTARADHRVRLRAAAALRARRRPSSCRRSPRWSADGHAARPRGGPPSTSASTPCPWSAAAWPSVLARRPRLGRRARRLGPAATCSRLPSAALTYFVVNQLLVSLALVAQDRAAAAGGCCARTWRYETRHQRRAARPRPAHRLPMRGGRRLPAAAAAAAARRLQDRAIALEREQQALTDVLTGLPNRKLLAERTADALRAGRRGRAAAARPRPLQGGQRHARPPRRRPAAAGGGRPADRSASGRGDTVARLGGDEFAAAAARHRRGRRPQATARRLLGVVSAPHPCSRDCSLDVGASIGIAVAPSTAPTSTSLMQRADVAMYLAKESGSGVELYDAQPDHNSTSRLAMLGELRRAHRRWPARGCTTSPRPTCAPAPSTASRRWCAGGTPSAAWSRRTRSSRWPSTAA